MADEDWVAIGYDERVDVVLDGQLVMLWWRRTPERAQRILHAQRGTQRVSLATASDAYVAADRTHRYRVTHGAIKAVLALDEPRPRRAVRPAVDAVADAFSQNLAAARAATGRLPVSRKATPAPEPTLRPTGGRRFVLDDDE